MRHQGAAPTPGGARSLLRLWRRVVAPLLVAIGLVLMHGGVGQAQACQDMSAMAQQAAVDQAMSGAEPIQMAGHDSQLTALHSQHHQPGHDPVGTHASGMCVSAPAACSGGDPKSGPAITSIDRVPRITPTGVMSIRRATGRHPPAPDLVSVLCVNRR